MKLIAFQVSESINLHKFKSAYTGKILEYDVNEVFYTDIENKYLFLFKFGVVCFLGYDDTEMTKLLALISDFSENVVIERNHEEYKLDIDPNNTELHYNEATIKEFDHSVIKLFMLNLSQSVALDYYSKQTEQLLEDIQKHTTHLEKFGKFKMNWTNLKKFIGKALNIKNRISENLYIFDSPPVTWENEYYDKIDQELKKIFDLQSRTRNIQEDIQIIKDNLDLFTNFSFHKKSTYLEWVVIILIMIEVVNMITDKLILK
jgi:required for meiotic nuclear division protein 1